MASSRAVPFAQEQPLTVVIPKPGLSARNLFPAGGKTADSSRDNAALRNDKSLGSFKFPRCLLQLFVDAAHRF
jgi:hypothetical protein